jgi:hypothetical protein
MLGRVAVSGDEAWLRKLRERATDWRFIAGKAGDAEAEWRIGDLLKVIERRLRELHAPPPRRNPAAESVLTRPGHTEISKVPFRTEVSN